MVVLRGVGDGEAHGHPVEERRADMEHELVRSAFELVAFEQRRVGAAVRVGLGVRDEAALFAVVAEQLDANADPRLAARGVEHMGGELAHQCAPNICSSLPRVMCPICSSAAPSSTWASFASRRSISSSTLARDACSFSATMHGKPNFSR